MVQPLLPGFSARCDRCRSFSVQTILICSGKRSARPAVPVTVDFMPPVFNQTNVVSLLTFGFFIAVALLASIFMFREEAKATGCDPQRIDSLCAWMLIAAILGARLFYFISRPDALADDVLEVLKPGGRLAVSDIVAQKPLPEDIQKDLAQVSACIGGAATIENTQKILKQAGFENITITPKKISQELINEILPGSIAGEYVVSANIQAQKPLSAT